MLKTELVLLVIAATLHVRAHAACQVDIAASEVDGLIHEMEARQDNLSRLVQDPDAARKGEAMWLQITVRQGVIEQVGQLQVLKLLIELRKSVTGQDNKQKVGEAQKALTRTVVANADALHSLVEQGRKTEARDAIGTELERIEETLKHIRTLGGDCIAAPAAAR